MTSIRDTFSETGPEQGEIELVRFPSEDFLNSGERLQARDEFFMDIAIQEALKSEDRGPEGIRNDLPLGAVVARGDELIAKAYTSDVRDGLPAAHADLLAMFRASVKLGESNGGTDVLKDCTLYVTLEPCLMCYHGARQHGVKDIVFGSSVADFPELFNPKKLRASEQALPPTYELPMRPNVRHQETTELLADYHRDPATGQVSKASDE